MSNSSLFRKPSNSVSSITVYSLWPVPEQRLQNALKGVSKVVVSELNMGQYRLEIERLVKDDVDVIGINRVDGELISPEEFLDYTNLT